jgi:hypothetical protein
VRVSAQRERHPEPAPSSLLARPDVAAFAPAAQGIQPTLAINEPGDAYETEADRASERVMRMAEPHRESAAAPAVDGPRPMAPPLVHEALRSPGRPLDPATRAFMEPRFGHDFSRVRVHTDSRAAESAQAIGARAYTAGASIVFGAGQYAPHTEAGQRLLAHELTHVVQGGRGAGVRRKEIPGTNVSHRGSVGPGDWLDRDREEWEILSLRGQERALSPTNTFMRAVYYNTQNIRPAEYQTIRERHDYYDLISYALQYDRNTPAALRDVRFFHATTAVTGHPGLGSVDRTIGAIKLGDTTRQILRDINAELFALNMRMIHNLIFQWQEPRSPTTPGSKAIGAFEFDMRMVETEQSAVEDYIRRNKGLFTPSVSQEINDTLDPDAFGQFFNFSATSFEWARDALQVKALDFRNKEHRKAIGFASVHIFHRKSYSDYELFVAAYHAVPQR